jgi:hypothetical protein
MSDATDGRPTDVPADPGERHLEHDAVGIVQDTIIGMASSAPAASIALTPPPPKAPAV